MIDEFSKHGWTIRLNKKNAQTIKGSPEKILKISKKTKMNQNSSRKWFLE